MALPQITQFAEEMKLIWVAVNPAECPSPGFLHMCGHCITLNQFRFVFFSLQACNVSYDDENGDEAADSQMFKLFVVFYL